LTAVAAYVDLRREVIPKKLTLLVLGLGVLCSVLRCAWLGASGQGDKVLLFGAHGPWIGALDGVVFALAGFAMGFALFFIMWILGTCGGGDVKLFAALGAWVGFQLALVLLIATLVIVSLFVVLRVLMTGSLRGLRKGGNGQDKGWLIRTLRMRLTYSLP